ncbi:MAG: hypothetical protein FPO08_15855 [Geobacter sp.]|nr:MAG: hypothetical protein FPO08_15855 [Geobacter sp.]
MKGFCRLFLATFLLTVSAQTVLADFKSALGAYRQQQFTVAAAEFRKCDNARSHFYLSLMYRMGWGVVQDKEESLKHLLRAKELEQKEESQVTIVSGR